jgi:hypothetical protein
MTGFTIEDIVLQHDRRGIGRVRSFLPPDNYLQSAQYILDHTGHVILTTGFYVKGVAETDGPPGTLALALALDHLGYTVTIISDRYCIPLFGDDRQQPFDLVEFPITDEAKSLDIAHSLLAEIQPALLISVERCGQTRHGIYLNMRGVDITPYTARLDHLFIGQPNTLGIGDGGNEIGMGLIYDQLRKMPELVAEPTTTATHRLLISSVSNWAVYGLLAALSILTRHDLLPSIDEGKQVIRTMLERGSMDGVTGEAEPRVDGFEQETSDEILDKLHAFVSNELLAQP